MKEYGLIAAIVAGVIAFFVIFVYLPIKLIPQVFSGLPSSKQPATVLTGTPVPGNTNTQTQTTNNNSENSGSMSAVPTNTQKTYTAAPSYYGLPDLQVELVSTGIINRYTGQYLATPYAGQNDEVAVQFMVRNVGTNVSGSFRVRLNMPSSVTPFYESPYQQSIRPGDAILFTGSFDGPIYQGVNTGYITVDPYSQIQEVSKANNNLAVTFNISGTNYNGAMPQSSVRNVLPVGQYECLMQWLPADDLCRQSGHLDCSRIRRKRILHL